jgi:hypothetical protein
MSTGRPCLICSDTEKSKLVSAMIAEGATDQAIADRLRDGIHRMAVSRHRRNHIEAPARAVAEAAAKGRAVVEGRAQVLAAAEQGDPAAFLALAEIVADLKKVHERLERTADAAERDNHRLAVSALAGQQLRAAEVRAKMGGVGAYAPTRGGADVSAGATKFSVNIIFPSLGRTETIDAVLDNEIAAVVAEAEETPDQ